MEVRRLAKLPPKKETKGGDDDNEDAAVENAGEHVPYPIVWRREAANWAWSA